MQLSIRDDFYTQLDIIKVSSAQGRGRIESLFKNEDGSDVPVRYVDKK